jgi:hypothetical protein
MSKEQERQLEKLDKQILFLSERSKNISYVDLISNSSEGWERDADLAAAQRKRRTLLEEMSSEE